EDSKWWDLVRSNLDNKKVSLAEVKSTWNRIVNKVNLLRGSIKPTLWNKYHVAGGSVGGRLVYVARIDFPIVYEKLFDRLLVHCPPENRFKTTRARCQIDFNYTHLDSSNIQCVKWMYVDKNLFRYR